MDGLTLIQELEEEIALGKLTEAKRKRQVALKPTGGEKKTGGARDFVSKNMTTMAGRGGAQKNKKGKGSYSRKKVNKNNY